MLKEAEIDRIVQGIVSDAYKQRDPAVKHREFWMRVNPIYWIRLFLASINRELFLKFGGDYRRPAPFNLDYKNGS